MSGFEKIILPKKKDYKTDNIKGVFKKLLAITDYTIPYVQVDGEYRFINHIDFIFEFNKADKMLLSEEVIRKLFEPINEEETLWRPRILYYNFSAVDDISRFFIGLELMKKLSEVYDFKIVKVNINNSYSAVLLNYFLWKIGVNPEDIKNIIPSEYKDIVTNKMLVKVWAYLESQYKGFIPMPGEWNEEGDNTVYSEDAQKYTYVKMFIGYLNSLMDTMTKIISIVIDRSTGNAVLFNSNYGAIVFYTLTKNVTKLQDYIKENNNVFIQPVYPNKGEFFIRVVTEGVENVISEVKDDIPYTQYLEISNSKTAVLVMDKIFGNDSFIIWSKYDYHGTAHYLIVGGETKFKEGIIQGEKKDWFSNLIDFLDKGLDWGISMLFAGDIMNDPEYYAPTRKDYIEEFLSDVDENTLKALKEAGYDV